MHVFLSLAHAAVLVLGQGEAADPPAPEAPAAVQEPAPEAAAEPAAEAPPPPSAAERPIATPQAGVGTSPQPADPPPPRARTSEPERAQVARAALAFLDALLAGDAAALAAASAERFSFDGEVRLGKEEIKRAWRAALASRDPAQRGALLDLEIVPATDAVARLGPPPARVAPLLATRGGWVAIANLSRRPVVLFLAREGGRFAVTGME